MKEEAVAKELEEETPFTGKLANFRFRQDSSPGTPGDIHCSDFYFDCSVGGSMTINEESSDVAWITEERLGHYDMVLLTGEALTRYWATTKQSIPSSNMKVLTGHCSTREMAWDAR